MSRMLAWETNGRYEDIALSYEYYNTDGLIVLVGFWEEFHLGGEPGAVVEIGHLYAPGGDS